VRNIYICSIGTITFYGTVEVSLNTHIITMLNNTFFVSSPLESFEVFELFGLHTMFGVNLSLTNLGLYATLIVVVLGGLHLLSVNSHRIVPSR
jgi:hypothetical protein